jgi:hypothetical protein
MIIAQGIGKGLAGFARRVARSRRGSSAVEFAMAFPALVLAVVAIIEFGAVMFTTVLMESALRDASRYGITGLEMDGVSRMDRIIAIVGDRTLGFVDMSEADFEVRVYPSFGDIGRGEAYVDGNGNGSYDLGETYSDENGNGSWDADIGDPGAGGPGEVVVYRIRYDWPLLTPLAAGLIGEEGKFTLRASLAVRNEPWVES